MSSDNLINRYSIAFNVNLIDINFWTFINIEYYIQETNTSRNCIIVFGVEIFNRNKELASIFYRKSKFSQKKLIFAAQGRIFDPMIEEERDLLDMLE